jgi:RNA polymerase sigma factor (sigma-70 family)
MLADQTIEPSAEERRQAVCAALAGAPGLIRYAARFTRSIEDAEDAYQRSMEIALTRAPVIDAAGFSSWLHVVIKNEAMAIADARRRELPMPDRDLEASATHERAAATSEPDAVMEWRERYRAIHDAMCGLTHSQRTCLMLRSAGLSRPEIAAITGYSERKIHRSIIEARSRLHAWEIRMAAGAECERAGELIDMTMDDRATRRERRALSRHLHHCHACRVRYRSRRDQVRALGSMVPVTLIGSEIFQRGTPDPSFVLTWWERVANSASGRTTHAMQLMTDLPALASTKAGAGAIAAAAAGAIGAPVMIDAVRSDRPIQTPPAIRSSVVTPPGVTARARVATVTKTPAAARVGAAPSARARLNGGTTSRITTPAPAKTVTATARITRPASGSRPPAPVSAALEFGP